MVRIGYALIITRRGCEESVRENIKSIEGVTSSESVDGMPDVVARVEAINLNKLNDIFKELRNINGVEQIETLTSVDETEIKCPECDAVLEIPEDVIKGEIITCPECGIDWEVCSVNPLRIEPAEKPGEDWGE